MSRFRPLGEKLGFTILLRWCLALRGSPKGRVKHRIRPAGASVGRNFQIVNSCHLVDCEFQIHYEFQNGRAESLPWDWEFPHFGTSQWPPF